MATTSSVSSPSNLQNLYDQAAQNIKNGNSQGAAQTTKKVAAAYVAQNPGATAQTFENAFAAAESGKVSSRAINTVVNQILPPGDDPSTTSVSAVASHGVSGEHGGGKGKGGRGATATSTSSQYDPVTHSYVQQ